MSYALVIHAEAAAELEAIYDYIADRAGPDVGWAYIDGVRQFLDALRDFPERGTIRESGAAAGLRVIGYRRRLGIAFKVGDDAVVILGFSYAGRDMEETVLSGRQTSRSE